MVTKNIVFYSFISIALMHLSSCSLFSPAAKKEDVLVVGTNSGFPPYEMLDNDGNLIGLDIDLAKIIAQKLGKKLELQDMAFDSLIIGLQQKKIDLILAGVSITQKRLEEVALIPYTGKPLTKLPLLFWHEIPAGVNSIYDLNHHSNKTVCTQSGTFQEEVIAKYDFITVKPLKENADLIMDIKFGKSIAAILETKVALAMKEQHPEIKILDLELKPEERDLGTGIGINKTNTQLVAQITSIINELKANGQIQKLEAQWIKGDGYGAQ